MKVLRIEEVKGFINGHLEAGSLVRVKNVYPKKQTIISVNHKYVAVLELCILYPCYMNCTQNGTPARIENVENRGGFLADDYLDVTAFGIVMSNTYSEVDFPPKAEEEEETYFASDRYFEDGYEASRGLDYFD